MSQSLRQVLVTGATGCVGHYVVEALLARGDCMVHLLARDPGKFAAELPADRTRWVVDDVRNLDRHAELLSTMDAVVHLATAWGDPIAYEVNVEATLTLARLVDPGRCRIFYFSTASILDAENRPMPAADTHGTDYIRSKYLAFKQLDGLANRDQIFTLFPTLIFGGSPHHPASHLTRGIPGILRYLWALRWFRLDGSLHFIHAEDIARMIAHWIDHAPPARDIVLGNSPLTIDALLDQLCAYHHLPRTGSIDLTPFGGLVAKLVGRRMNSWDRYSLTHRHFVYQATNPRTLGLAPGLETIQEILYERDPKVGLGFHLGGALKDPKLAEH